MSFISRAGNGSPQLWQNGPHCIMNIRKQSGRKVGCLRKLWITILTMLWQVTHCNEGIWGKKKPIIPHKQKSMFWSEQIAKLKSYFIRRPLILQTFPFLRFFLTGGGFGWRRHHHFIGHLCRGIKEVIAVVIWTLIQRFTLYQYHYVLHLSISIMSNLK